MKKCLLANILMLLAWRLVWATLQSLFATSIPFLLAISISHPTSKTANKPDIPRFSVRFDVYPFITFVKTQLEIITCSLIVLYKNLLECVSVVWAKKKKILRFIIFGVSNGH